MVRFVFRFAARPLIAVALFAVSSCAAPSAMHGPTTNAASSHRARLLPAIQHVVILEMENRSFDNYFATFPGANGIPMDPNGVPLVTCNPDPRSGLCVLPFHDTQTVNYGGPHSTTATATDLDGGMLDGFVVSAETRSNGRDPSPDEVMGYHTQAEIPYYWRLATRYTLADNFFAATSSYSTVAHIYAVSGWSARCKTLDPMSCKSNNNVGISGPPTYAWTDLTWILHQHGVSWNYFVFDGGSPHQITDDDEYVSPFSYYDQLSLWNPMPAFEDVAEDGEEGNIAPGTTFIADATAGTLPAVSWVIPPFTKSDHPPSDISIGQQFVQRLVSAVQHGPEWQSTVIFIQWDEWGGFYDHVVPPVIDGLGYGFRVPMIIVSPLAKQGYIDHQLLSSDAELKFIEDLFCGSQRLDSTDGRPDPRPDVREAQPSLGDLSLDFN